MVGESEPGGGNSVEELEYQPALFFSPTLSHIPNRERRDINSRNDSPWNRFVVKFRGSRNFEVKRKARSKVRGKEVKATQIKLTERNVARKCKCII